MAPQYLKDQPAGFKNYIENVAIVGAGGTVGKFITEELLKAGKQKVTAITRENSTSTFPSGVLVKKADYDNHESLVEALKGQDILIITLSVFAAPDSQNKLIDAAKGAGVPLIMPNEWGMDGTDEPMNSQTLIGPGKTKVRGLIEGAGMDWIGIACMFWYEFSLAGGTSRYGFDIEKKTLQLYEDGEMKIPTSTWEQVGRTVAALMALKIFKEDENDKSVVLDHWRNRFVITYSFNLSQKEMLASICRVTGDQESNWTTSSVKTQEYYHESVKKLQETGDRIYFGQALYSRQWFPDSNQVEKFGSENEKLGLPKEDLDAATKRALELSWGGYFK